MPIFDFACQACGEEFETWVRKRDETPTCPACESTEVEKLFSPATVHGEGSHDKAMRAARKRDQVQARDRYHERRRYEESHDRHGH
jgi:putative FmdB family regulatory protein